MEQRFNGKESSIEIRGRCVASTTSPMKIHILRNIRIYDSPTSLIEGSISKVDARTCINDTID